MKSVAKRKTLNPSAPFELQFKTICQLYLLQLAVLISSIFDCFCHTTLCVSASFSASLQRLWTCFNCAPVAIY